MRRLALSLALMLAACGAERTVALEPVAGSGVHGSVFLHEAITKSFSLRVDAFVEVDAPTPDMRAAALRGGCASPGAVVKALQVHPRGEGGAADVVLEAGRLAELVGSSIHVYAGEPEASARVACGEL